MKRYELAPNGTQKSFYGKAVVEIDNAGNETLYSYNTPIIKRRRITVHFTDNGGKENES